MATTARRFASSTSEATIMPIFGNGSVRRTQVLQRPAAATAASEAASASTSSGGLVFPKPPSATVAINAKPVSASAYAAGHASGATHVRGFVLDEPVDDTPAAIEAAVCPVCRQGFPLKALLQHIYTTHPAVDREYTRKIVRERYTMLKLAQQKYPNAGAGAASSSQQQQQQSGGGPAPELTTGYPCRHCDMELLDVTIATSGQQPVRAKLYATVDAVMKHIMDAHPQIDVDEEPIPSLCSRSTGGGWGGVSRAGIPVPAPPAAASDAALVFTDTQFPCEVCRKVFKSEVDLIQHLDTAHADVIAEPCDAAAAVAAEAAAPTQTLTTMGKVRPVATAAQRDLVSTYIPTSMGPISVSCDLCVKAKVFTSEVALHAHIVSKHPEVDDPAEKVKELLQRDVDAHVCPHCCKAFPTAQALYGHMSSKHAGSMTTAEVAMVPVLNGGASSALGGGEVIPGGVWWCNDCNRGFKSGSALTGHLTTKHGLPTQSLPCPACRRVFCDVFALQTHVSQAHKNLDDTIYDATGAACTKCPRRFLTSTALQAHMKTFHKNGIS